MGDEIKKVEQAQAGATGVTQPATPPAQPDPKAAKPEPSVLEFLGPGLIEDIRKTVETEGKPPVVPAIIPAEQVPAATTPPPAAKPEEKPKGRVTVKKAEETVRQIAGKILEEEFAKRAPVAPASAPTPASGVPPLPPKQEQKPDESKLTWDQKRELRLARFVESKEPIKKGLADQLLNFYRDVDEYVAAGKKADPERRFDDEDTEFVEFVQRNRPVRWTDEERDQLEEERVEARLVEKARKVVEPEVTAAKREATEAKRMPGIEKRLAQFDAKLGDRLKSESDDKWEGKVFEKHRYAITQLARTALRMKDFLPSQEGFDEFDSKNELHKYLINLRDTTSDDFAKNGGESRNYEGRKFVTPTKYFELKKAAGGAEPTGFWTMGADNFLQVLENYADYYARDEIKTELARREQDGFTRVKKPSVTQSEKIEVPPAGLVATTTPGPALINPPVTPGVKTEAEKIVNGLGINVT